MTNQPSPYPQSGIPAAKRINHDQKFCPVVLMLLHEKISVSFVPKMVTLLKSIPSPKTLVKSISQPKILMILVLSGAFGTIEMRNVSILVALNFMLNGLVSPGLHTFCFDVFGVG